MPRLVLASRSPQREAILARLGLQFTSVVPEVDELAAGDPEVVVVENALRKARAAVAELSGEELLVVGGDTVIALDGAVIGKPAGAAEAAEFMRRLSGREHLVVGGLAVVRPGQGEATAVSTTRIVFRPLSERQIELHVASGEWQERSGGYAIQQGAATLVERIDGDYLNVIGLSVNDLARLAPELQINAQ